MEDKRIVRCKKCKKPISYRSGSIQSTKTGIHMSEPHFIPEDLKLEAGCNCSTPYCQKCYLSYVKKTPECNSRSCTNHNQNGDVCALYPKVKSYIKKGGDIETMPIRMWADKISEQWRQK